MRTLTLQRLFLSLLVLLICGCGADVPIDPGPAREDIEDRIVTSDWERLFRVGRGERVNDVSATIDGDILLAGYGVEADSSTQMLIRRLAGDGSLRWERLFGDRFADLASSVAATPDGGCIAVGSSGNDLYIVKLDRAGAIEWDRFHRRNRILYPGKVVVTADGYAISGSHQYQDYTDVFVLSLDLRGEERWFTSVGSPDQESAADLATTSDGGFVVTAIQMRGGEQPTTGLGIATIVYRIGRDGGPGWSRPYDHVEVPGHFAAGIAATSDNACIVSTGNAAFDARDARSGARVVTIDASGSERSTRVYADLVGPASALAIHPDGGLAMLLTGGALLRTDASGSPSYVAHLRTDERPDGLTDGVIMPDGRSYVVAGNTVGPWIGTNSRVLVARYRLPE